MEGDLVAFHGPVWRLLPKALLLDPRAAASAPEGRFHHDGQVAAYASLSPEGAEVAMKRYLPDKIARALVALRLDADRVADVRGQTAASIVWQDFRARGERPSTGEIADAARRAGAQAVLYSSRSRPDLAHVVVFDVDCLTDPDADYSGENIAE